jgi:hypothetical protein
MGSGTAGFSEIEKIRGAGHPTGIQGNRQRQRYQRTSAELRMIHVGKHFQQ